MVQVLDKEKNPKHTILLEKTLVLEEFLIKNSFGQDISEVIPKEVPEVNQEPKLTTEVKAISLLDLFPCPFINICIIPKKEFCTLPKCKLCPEYVLICQRLNPNYLF